MINMLYDANAARLLLTALMIKPQLLLTDKIKLTQFDFEPVDFHKRLFQSILYLAKHGATQIEAIDVYTTVNNHPDIKEIYDDNNLKDFIITMKQIVNIDNIEVYYDIVKKYSILREYTQYGFNIDKFVNNIDEYTVKDIIAHYEGINIEVKKKYYKDDTIEEAHAGDGFENIKESFKETPMFGASTFSDYLNTATRGWIKGQLSCHSVFSGGGKSTLGIYNLVKVCCPRIYDIYEQAYIDNPFYQGEGGLYMQFEMDIKKEVTPKFIASISAVPCHHILNGQYEYGEEKRVDEAIEILKQSNIYIVLMPNYTIELIDNYVKDYVINHNVGYVCYDYIAESASLSTATNKASGGTALRTDQTLLAMASGLKDIAVKYNVAVLTFTQVNRGAYNNEQLDETVISGAMSIKNKLDVGSIISPIRKSDKETLDMMMDSHFPNSPFKPNRILTMHKIRFGNTEQNIKIWIYLDLSTGRVEDYFVTDKDNKPLNISKTQLVVDK